jgi:hypothetical protein
MSDKISRTVYPNLHFPRHRMPAGPPPLDLPLEMIPDFRPEQVRPRALLKLSAGKLADPKRLLPPAGLRNRRPSSRVYGITSTRAQRASRARPRTRRRRASRRLTGGPRRSTSTGEASSGSHSRPRSVQPSRFFSDGRLTGASGQGRLEQADADRWLDALCAPAPLRTFLQVTQPFVVAVVTFFASLALKSVRAYIQTGIRNAMH